jgi:hypothetical protein
MSLQLRPACQTIVLLCQAPCRGNVWCAQELRFQCHAASGSTLPARCKTFYPSSWSCFSLQLRQTPHAAAMRSITMLSPCNEPCEHGCALLLVHCLITADPPTTCMNQPSRHWCPSCPRHSYHHHHHHHNQDSTSWHAVPLLLTYCISRAPDPTQSQLHTSDTPVCPAAAAPPAMLGQA